jgi:hypothetical protein
VRSVCAFILALIFLTPVQVSHSETRQCAVVKAEAGKILDDKYQSTDSALMELAKRTVKIYRLIIQNKECFSAKEYRSLVSGIKELKQSCDQARKDEFSWEFMKGICKAYSPLWKYIR